MKRKIALLLTCSMLISSVMPAYGAQEAAEKAVCEETAEVAAEDVADETAVCALEEAADEAAVSCEEDVDAAVVDSGTLVNETNGKSFDWTLDDQGVLTITGEGSMRFENPSGDSDKQTSIYEWGENRRLADNHSLDVKKLVVKDGVTRLGCSLCEGFENLEEVDLAVSVYNVGWWCFKGCKKLKKCYMYSDMNDDSDISRGAFEDCTSLVDVRIPLHMSQIDQENFCGCTSLESIEIPYSIADCPDRSFMGCTSLKTIYWPRKLKHLGPRCFEGCTSLTELVLPKRFDNMTGGTFRDCTSLKVVKLPKSTKKITDNCFAGCTAITDVYYEGSEADWKKITIGEEGNETLLNAKMHFNAEYDAQITDYRPGTSFPGSNENNGTYDITDRSRFISVGLVSKDGSNRLAELGSEAVYKCPLVTVGAGTKFMIGNGFKEAYYIGDKSILNVSDTGQVVAKASAGTNRAALIYYKDNKKETSGSYRSLLVEITGDGPTQGEESSGTEQASEGGQEYNMKSGYDELFLSQGGDGKYQLKLTAGSVSSDESGKLPLVKVVKGNKFFLSGDYKPGSANIGSAKKKVAVNKKGMVSAKKSTGENTAVKLNYRKTDGSEASVLICVIEPAINKYAGGSGNAVTETKKLTATASLSSGKKADIALFLPKTATLDESKVKNSGAAGNILDSYSFKYDETDGCFHLKGNVANKGTATFPASVYGKKFKIKIKVKD